jgi:hypothetical protein
MLLHSNRFLSNLASGSCGCAWTALSKPRLLAMLELKGTHRNDVLVDMLTNLKLSS